VNARQKEELERIVVDTMHAAIRTKHECRRLSFGVFSKDACQALGIHPCTRFRISFNNQLDAQGFIEALASAVDGIRREIN
jgi:hypothetical protein